MKSCISNSIKDSVSIFIKFRFAKPRKRKLVNNFLKTTFEKSAAKQALNITEYNSQDLPPRTRKPVRIVLPTGILIVIIPLQRIQVLVVVLV